MTSADDASRQAHRQSLHDFIAVAQSVPEESWERPLGVGKWSPAQVTEHLRLTYEVVLAERAGGTGLRIRSKWWLRPILRFRILPMILRRGVLPRGARAPREIRPGTGPFERAPMLDALLALGTSAGEALSGALPTEAGFTHHVFGSLTAQQALRFATVHNQHHARQLTALVNGQ